MLNLWRSFCTFPCCVRTKTCPMFLWGPSKPSDELVVCRDQSSPRRSLLRKARSWSLRFSLYRWRSRDSWFKPGVIFKLFVFVFFVYSEQTSVFVERNCVWDKKCLSLSYKNQRKEWKWVVVLFCCNKCKGLTVRLCSVCAVSRPLKLYWSIWKFETKWITLNLFNSDSLDLYGWY